MKTLSSSLLLGGLMALAATSLPVSAQSFARGDDQRAARRAMLDGEVMPFSIIKRRVEREISDAQYVGVAPSVREGVYRMQFLQQDGKVIWVDVDGKTGNIIGRTR
ncbi:hypothetical protein M2333_000387 [Sphingobium sp. B11D3B]|uniref:hypothetical protein n=1 Tax=unclassified Sphingobium TaxID=2611147 RepID=UPI002223F4DC|nr:MULTISPECIES: hypothetical protein [unclassified Sphingobium]MCW2349733.1 hypothetical protein [Sphingobium sp. B12D2B]MCW2368851.1 hypothetical protein [Sphingobium sp. B11D3D]MCW2387341.1 hypothetical protein [Sphingobium sp. B11D3B]